MSSGSSPIGVFDSGAGGLSVVAAIREQLPTSPIIYYADSAWAPYGERPAAEIVARAEHVGRWLLRHEVAAIVVACNTATALAVETLRGWAPVPVVGVEPGLKPAAAATRNGRVGVLATAATLASERYLRLAERIAGGVPGLQFLPAAGRGWVELVEAGELDTTRARQAVAAALAPLLAQDVDTLVLGCTHYPFLAPLIRACAPGLPLVETAAAVARQLARRLPAGAAAGPSVTPAPLRLASSAAPGPLEELARRLLPGMSLTLLGGD